MKRIITILVMLAFLAACEGAGSIKREGLAPPVSKKFDLEGHLLPKDSSKNLKNGKGEVVPIPSLMEIQGLNEDPSQAKKLDLYSISAVNVPISDLLYHLSVDAGKELDLDSKVKGSVTINAINQPLGSIVQRVVNQVGAVYTIQHNVITVRLDVPYWHSYKIDYVNVSKKVTDTTVMKMSVGSVGEGSASNAASEFNMVVESKHDFWDTLYKNVVSMASLTGVAASSAKSTSSNQVVMNREAGIISVNTTANRQLNIKDYLNQVSDRATKQVLIEATVVEVELNDRYQAGVDWNAITSGSGGSSSISQGLVGTNLSTDPAFSINLSSLGAFNFNVGIKMLQQFGDAKVLSSPKIMAINNQSALLKVVDNEVYFTVDVTREPPTLGSVGFTTFESTVHTVPVGFMMNMTPFISDNDEISINISPSLSRIVGYVNDPNPDLAREGVVSRIPIIQEREMDSILRLRDRQTAILGGLIQDKHDNKKTSVPLLGSIPWIGDLFSYRDDTIKKSELIIFIRPIIVKNPDIENGDLQGVKHLLKTKFN